MKNTFSVALYGQTAQNNLLGRTVTAPALTCGAAGEAFFKAYLNNIILQK